MPYKSIQDLPVSVKSHTPSHAQKIYLEAFNNAWVEYSNPTKRSGTNESREEVAHKVAWAAVKKRYTKKGRQWVLAVSS